MDEHSMTIGCSPPLRRFTFVRRWLTFNATELKPIYHNLAPNSKHVRKRLTVLILRCNLLIYIYIYIRMTADDDRRIIRNWPVILKTGQFCNRFGAKSVLFWRIRIGVNLVVILDNISQLGQLIVCRQNVVGQLSSDLEWDWKTLLYELYGRFQGPQISLFFSFNEPKIAWVRF